MAYPQSRSANHELDMGMVDGTYKQRVKDRGGVVDSATTRERHDLSGTYFNICEAPVMLTPDGRSVSCGA